MTTPGEIRRQALAILESHWDAALQATLPHPLQYPHRWLWDSCFHAIAWAALGRPEGLVELSSVLGSSVPFQAWDFTVATGKSLAGPGLTMQKLAYQCLATHHASGATTVMTMRSLPATSRNRTPPLARTGTASVKP